MLRSPPHARIVSIDTSKAEALPGVKAVITRDDFGDQPSEFIPAGEMMMNYKDVVRNVMAREKALYEATRWPPWPPPAPRSPGAR